MKLIIPKISLLNGAFYLLILFFFIFTLLSILEILPFAIQMDVDSLTYHIPLAEHFSTFNYVNLDNVSFGLGYYPGIGEVLLSFFMLLRLPIDFYNPVIWVLLFFSLKSLYRKISSNQFLSVVFAASVCLIPSVIRLLFHQKVDILVLLFFSELLKNFLETKKQDSTYLKIGIFAGLLIGTKYSGVYFVIFLFIVFAKEFFKKINIKKVLLVIVPIILFGLSWYLRNFIYKGNPLYPIGFLGFDGNSGLFPVEYTLFRTIFSLPNGLWLIVQSYISEYLIWSLAPICLFSYILVKKIRKEKIERIYWQFLAFFVLGVLSLLTLTGADNFQSGFSIVRFSYPVFLPVILGCFLIAEKVKLTEQLTILALLSSISVLPLFNYHPKLIIVWLIISGLYLFIRPR